MGQRRRKLKQWSGGMKGMIGKLIIAAIVLVVCTFSLFSSRSTLRSTTRTEVSSRWFDILRAWFCYWVLLINTFWNKKFWFKHVNCAAKKFRFLWHLLEAQLSFIVYSKIRKFRVHEFNVDQHNPQLIIAYIQPKTQLNLLRQFEGQQCNITWYECDDSMNCWMDWRFDFPFYVGCTVQPK